ncbi:hypothetical protein ACLK15_17425 [Escherichia coli]
MVWLANPERYGQMQYRYCGEKVVYACPRYRSVYGTISVTLTRWNHSVRSCVKRLIWALRTLI